MVCQYDDGVFSPDDVDRKLPGAALEGSFIRLHYLFFQCDQIVVFGSKVNGNFVVSNHAVEKNLISNRVGKRSFETDGSQRKIYMKLNINIHSNSDCACVTVIDANYSPLSRWVLLV